MLPSDVNYELSDGGESESSRDSSDDDNLALRGLAGGLEMLVDDDGEERILRSHHVNLEAWTRPRDGPGQGRGPRGERHKKPTTETRWWGLITDATVTNPLSKLGKRFRRQFRVPFPLFERIVKLAQEWVDDKGKPVFAVRTSIKDERSTFVEIKVLMALRWLATGAFFDLIGNAAETSETSARTASEDFVFYFAHTLKKWLEVPNDEDLRAEMAVFAALGLPGCAFSVDVV